MRKTSILFLFVLAGFFGMEGFAQTVQTVNANLSWGNKRFSPVQSVSPNRTVTCGLDSVEYPLAKATGLRALSVNNSTSAQAVSQYYDCPQDITISGFSFFGWSSSLPVVPVTCSVFYLGADSLPTGAPVATAVYNLDTVFGTGALDVLQRDVTFSSPVTLTQPYCLVVQNLSANNVAVVSNDYTVQDGQMEWLASVDLFGTWTHGYDVLVGGNQFNGDFMLHPHVTYDLTSDFSTTGCYDVNVPVNFTNASSPIVNNRMYSVAAFVGNPRLSYTWDFGDGSATVNAVDTMHTYTTGGTPYTVTLTDTLFGWTSNCSESSTQTLAEGSIPGAAWSSSANLLVVDFTDASTGTITSHLWDFGDGNTSTMQNPQHTYATSGSYTVCLTVTTACGSDSSCTTINVTSVGIEDELETAVKLYPNPASNQLFVALDLSYDQDITLNVYNAVGHQVRSVELGSVSTDKVGFDLSDFANGTYLMEVRSGDEMIVKRFNVMR